jgi:hypothetical protein
MSEQNYVLQDGVVSPMSRTTVNFEKNLLVIQVLPRKMFHMVDELRNTRSEMDSKDITFVPNAVKIA